MQRVKKGLFITFEGIEGSGKTTQINLLAQRLRRRGFSVLVTREPGGTPQAERIRAFLLDSRNTTLTPEMEILLYEAARRDHVQRVIRPALRKNRLVLCDRFSDATVAYQGYGRGLPVAVVHRLNVIASCGLRPNLTFLFDLTASSGLGRVRRRRRKLDRLEAATMLFHRKVRNGYLTLARKEKRRFRIIHARRPRSQIAAAIYREVEKFL